MGLFGGLGTGNLGNDASLEAILRYLRTDHPEAVLDAMCGGPEIVYDRYGVPGIPSQWYQRYDHRASGVAAIALKALGKGVDAFRIASWVRRHDVVIVPGMGVLETSLPVRPWQSPYAIFCLCAAGRVFRTKVALVSVGSSFMNKRLTGWLFTSAARLAFYRSYRDAMSHDALRQQGLDTTRDQVYPDLVFSIPVPPCEPGDAQTVGIGVMDYYGTNDDDRRHASEIHDSYVEKMKFFARWLVDNGHKIRLFVGDANGSDDTVVQEILADLQATRPDLDPTWVVAEPVSTFAELVRAMAPAGIVVATRYHNLICALMLSRPTISIGYAAKNNALMDDMGLPEYCQSVNSLDTGLLIEQFTRLESDATRLRQTISEHNAAYERLLERQFKELSAALFPAAEPAYTAADRNLTRRGAR